MHGVAAGAASAHVTRESDDGLAVDGAVRGNAEGVRTTCTVFANCPPATGRAPWDDAGVDVVGVGAGAIGTAPAMDVVAYVVMRYR